MDPREVMAGYLSVLGPALMLGMVLRIPQEAILASVGGSILASLAYIWRNILLAYCAAIYSCIWALVWLYAIVVLWPNRSEWLVSFTLPWLALGMVGGILGTTGSLWFVHQLSPRKSVV